MDQDSEHNLSTENSRTVVQNEPAKEQIIYVEDKLRNSFMDYAMSVIVSRALPDVRDGLKPVHRRILFAMNELDMMHNKPYKKCARIVGEVLGKYHPHGDVAVYDSLVRMAQDFSLRYTLVDGQGNFGSLDGDSAASMRYTEARLTRISEDLLSDLDKDTVDFMPNFDESLKEPVVLPSLIPNLLINGSSGIAVGMATNIPPHNIAEVCDATIAVLDNPALEPGDLLQYVKGPDFPTGGIIQGRSGIMGAYLHGRGHIKLKAKCHDEQKGNKQLLIITEIPYNVNKAELIKEISDLVNNKEIQGVTDLRDESNREGIRVVIEMRKDANVEIIKNNLFKKTRCQVTFPVMNLALVNNRPKIFNLKDMLSEFIAHRKNVVTRRTQYELRKAEERMHILIGFTKALDKLDDTIALIKSSKDVATARDGLMFFLEITEIQAKAILDLKLQRLTSMERDNIIKEYNDLNVKIIDLKDILGNEERIKSIIKEETKTVKKTYGDERKTEIIDGGEDELDFDMEDFIEDEDVIVTLSKEGYVKRAKIEEYKQQCRGGKGVIGATTKEEDYIVRLFSATTKTTLLVFTNKGRLYWLKVYLIPDSSRTGKGKPIVNFIQLEQDEKVATIIPVKEFSDKYSLCMVTKNGVAKKMSLDMFSKPRRSGVIAMTLRDNDQLIDVLKTEGQNDVVLATHNGLAVRFDEAELREIGKTAMGVRGIHLKDNDYCVSALVASQTSNVLTICENGFGKRTIIDEYRKTHRAGSGVINIKVTERNGGVAKVLNVTDEDDIIITTKNGIMIRTPVRGISMIGRNTQGVRLIKLDENDIVIDAAVVRE